jgi:hypothetical protein
VILGEHVDKGLSVVFSWTLSTNDNIGAEKKGTTVRGSISASEGRHGAAEYAWAYAQWAYDAATDTFNPSELDPRGHECGYGRSTDPY